MKSSHAHSTMKAILSLLVQRTTHAESGRISLLLRVSRSLRQQASEHEVMVEVKLGSSIHSTFFESNWLRLKALIIDQ